MRVAWLCVLGLGFTGVIACGSDSSSEPQLTASTTGAGGGGGQAVVAPECGDGVVEEGEECEPGLGPGCTERCQLHVQPGWSVQIPNLEVRSVAVDAAMPTWKTTRTTAAAATPRSDAHAPLHQRRPSSMPSGRSRGQVAHSNALQQPDRETRGGHAASAAGRLTACMRAPWPFYLFSWPAALRRTIRRAPRRAAWAELRRAAAARAGAPAEAVAASAWAAAGEAPRSPRRASCSSAAPRGSATDPSPTPSLPSKWRA